MKLKFAAALLVGALSISTAPGCTAVVFDTSASGGFAGHGKEYRIPDATRRSRRGFDLTGER